MCDRSGDRDNEVKSKEGFGLEINPDTQPPPAVVFGVDENLNGEPIGTLFLDTDGKLKFEGDMDEAAKLMVESILRPWCDNYITERLKKAKELCRKYATASEYHDKIMEGKFIEMPFLTKKLVNQVAQEILDEIEDGQKRTPENSSDVPGSDKA